jgi:hypothetical protein
MKYHTLLFILQPAEDQFDDIVERFSSFHRGFMRYVMIATDNARLDRMLTMRISIHA